MTEKKGAHIIPLIEADHVEDPNHWANAIVTTLPKPFMEYDVDIQRIALAVDRFKIAKAQRERLLLSYLFFIARKNKTLSEVEKETGHHEDLIKQARDWLLDESDQDALPDFIKLKRAVVQTPTFADIPTLLEGYLQQLPAQVRNAAILSAKGMSALDIAAQLPLTYNSVKTFVSRARLGFERAVLQPNGFSRAVDAGIDFNHTIRHPIPAVLCMGVYYSRPEFLAQYIDTRRREIDTTLLGQGYLLLTECTSQYEYSMLCKSYRHLLKMHKGRYYILSGVLEEYRNDVSIDKLDKDMVEKGYELASRVTPTRAAYERLIRSGETVRVGNRQYIKRKHVEDDTLA